MGALVRVVHDLGDLERIEQGGDGRGPRPRVVGGAEQQGEPPRPPVPRPQVLPRGQALAELQREPPREQRGTGAAEVGDLLRQVRPHHRPVAVQREPHRTEVPRPGQPGEPVRGDPEERGGLTGAHRAHPVAQAGGKVRRGPEAVELAPLDPPPSALSDRHRPDQAELHREPELVAFQLQFLCGPRRCHRARPSVRRPFARRPSARRPLFRRPVVRRPVVAVHRRHVVLPRTSVLSVARIRPTRRRERNAE